MLVKSVTMEMGRMVVLGGGGRDKVVTPPTTIKEIETIMKRKRSMEKRPPLPKTLTIKLTTARIQIPLLKFKNISNGTYSGHL